MPRKAKVDFLLNRKSGIVHRRVGGRTYEQCNIDQVKDKRVELHLVNLPYKRLCVRCFYELEDGIS